MPCGTGAIFISDRRDSKSTTLRSRVSNQPSGLLLSATGCGSQRLLHALRGVRILLAAAPTTPPCFCRRQRSSLLQVPPHRNVYRGCWIRKDSKRAAVHCTAISPVGCCLVPRVAAPSVCFTPCAAFASCWPLPQQLLPVSAAGSGRRCCKSHPIGMSTGDAGSGGIRKGRRRPLPALSPFTVPPCSAGCGRCQGSCLHSRGTFPAGHPPSSYCALRPLHRTRCGRCPSSGCGCQAPMPDAYCE